MQPGFKWIWQSTYSQWFHCIGLYISLSFTTGMGFRTFSFFHLTWRRSWPSSSSKPGSWMSLPTGRSGEGWRSRGPVAKRQGSKQGWGRCGGDWVWWAACLHRHREGWKLLSENTANLRNFPWISDFELSVFPAIFNTCLAGRDRSMSLIAGTGGAMAYPFLSLVMEVEEDIITWSPLQLGGELQVGLIVRNIP